jgi:hypothetical protein
VRLPVGDSLRAEDVVLANVGLPLTTAGLARAVHPPSASPSASAGGESCWTIEIEPRLTDPAGGAVLGTEPVSRWERLLREGDPACRRLLAPVLGAAALADGDADHARGLRGEDGWLSICSSVPIPDLRQRLLHPRLWILRPAADGQGASGPGPFFAAGGGGLEANRRPAVPGPHLDRIELVPDRDAPDLLLRLGEIDLAVLFGRNAAALLAGDTTHLEAERIRDWDRVYFLWFDTSRRWVNDPRFRRWIAELVDRDAAVRYLFDGQGEPADRLLASAAPERGHREPVTRPVSADSTPRLVLAYDDRDPHAAILAARVKAVAETNGVVLRLKPAGADRSYGDIVLGSHQPFTEEPVLGLLDGLAGLPAMPDEAIATLRKGAERERPDLRARAATSVESGLLDEGRIAPLVRVHAWLVRDPALRGVRTGPPGMLLLEDAWWSR